MSNVSQRDPHKGISWRFFVFIGILLLMFGYLASGLVRLQLVNSEEYAEKAESVRTKTIVLRGKRGNITDADSVILAKDELVYNITFTRMAPTSVKAIIMSTPSPSWRPSPSLNATAASWPSIM